MQDSNAPIKIPSLWANAAGGSFITYPVPTASQQGITNGAASFADGFPPDCFIPYASGGAGPLGKDYNGLLKQVTSGIQWSQTGAFLPYDSTWQGVIGGYPAGSIVQSATTALVYWLSLVDNNATNPDTGGSGWAPLSFVSLSTTPVGAGINKYYNGSCQIAQRGSPITVTPGSPVYTLDGILVGCSGASVTVTQTGPLGPAPNSITITGQVGVTDCFIIRPIESLDAVFLANSTVMHQHLLVNNTAGSMTPSITVKYPGAQDVWTSSTAFVSSAALQSIASGLTGPQFYVFNAPSAVSAGMSVRIDLGGALNGVGYAATLGAWDIRSVGASTKEPPLPEVRLYFMEELQCQRYLPAWDAAGTVSHMYFSAGGSFDAPNAGAIVMQFFTRCRTNCTGVTFSNLSHFNVNYRGTVQSLSSLVFDSNNIGPFFGNLNFTTSGLSANAGEVSNLIAVSGSARLYFTGAELIGGAI